MRTTIKTLRLTHPMLDQLAREAEKRNTNSADIVRIAIAEYFQRKHVESAFLAAEQRITACVVENARALASGIEEILDLAQPDNGGVQ